MHTPRAYKLRQISYLEANDKLWGWFVLDNGQELGYNGRITYYSYAWCWWCERGKTITVKRHNYNIGYMKSLETRKSKNGYAVITEAELLQLWPDFREQLDNTMIFELLSYHDEP